jgi:hypothetical protein
MILDMRMYIADLMMVMSQLPQEVEEIRLIKVHMTHTLVEVVLGSV